MNTHDESARALNGQHGSSNGMRRRTNRAIMILVIAALALLAGIWIWKSVQINHLRKEAALEKQELQQQSANRIVQTHATHLKVLAKPFVWAVRTEMLKNNISQVNLYANDMVKEKSFQKILIANDKGVVILSTNKKDEGKEFASVGKPAYLAADSTMVDNINDSLLVVSSAIMGFNNRIGTLLITYAVQRPAFK